MKRPRSNKTYTFAPFLLFVFVLVPVVATI